MIFGDREDLCREVMYEMERQEGHAFRLELYFTLLFQINYYQPTRFGVSQLHHQGSKTTM